MMIVGDLFQLAEVHETREVLKVEHRVVLAVLAEERNVLAEIHVFEVKRDEAAITALDAFAEFCEDR